MSSSMPPAIIVMMMSSPMPVMPVPIAAHHSHSPMLPVAHPMMPVVTTPMTSTSITFMPAVARASTVR